MKKKLVKDFHQMFAVCKRTKNGQFPYWIHQRAVTDTTGTVPNGCYRIYSNKRGGMVLEINKKRNEEVCINYTAFHSETF